MSTALLDSSESTVSDIPKFNSPHEEISYLKRKLQENQLEFQEYQESSRELELELEAQIRELDKKFKDVSNQNVRLENENSQLKSKYGSYSKDTQLKLNDYEKQLSQLTSSNNRLTSYIRQLEQKNDDWERQDRATKACLSDVSSKVDQLIERGVLLEDELEYKNQMEQRLKEELTDLRHELKAKNTALEALKKSQIDQADTTEPSQTTSTSSS